MAEDSDPADEQDRRTATRVGVAAASIVGAIAVTTVLIVNAQQPAPPAPVAASTDLPTGQWTPTSAVPAPPQSTGSAPAPVTRSGGSGCPGENEEGSGAASSPTQAPAAIPAAATPNPSPSSPVTRSRGS